MWKKVSIFYIVVLALFVFVLTAFNVQTLFQEGNPLPVFRAIVKLELTGTEIVPFAENKLLQKAGPETPLSDYLSVQGWIFKDRLGSAIFYEKNDESLSVCSRMLTRRYVVYELGN